MVAPWPWERVSHPSKPSVQEHYAEMLTRFERKVRPMIEQGELNRLGLLYAAYAKVALRREAEGR